MKKSLATLLSVSAASYMMSALLSLCPSLAQGSAPPSQSPHTTLIYFVRHAEDADELVDPSYTITFNNAVGSCHETVLNPLGKMRAVSLAEWFEARHITKTLTHVIATHKIRTRQTVAPIAQAAGLGGDLDGDGILDGTDLDQAPGDGVINVPSFPEECTPGWTSSASVIGPQINYLNTLPLGSRAVLCSHSPAVYPIMRAFGIDTSDPVKFPKTGTANTTSERVKGFNNVWAVELSPVQVGGTWTYQGRLLDHVLLDFQLDVTAIDRDYGNRPNHQSSDDKE
jgi:phosphohistidine phosphatase SixA